jgi:heat shock protein HslJ
MRAWLALVLVLVLVGCGTTGGTPAPSDASDDPNATELIDQPWALDSLVVGDVASAPAGEPATLELRSDGTLRGSTGCRGFRGGWIERGNQILATSLSMDEAECPAWLAAQDSHVVSVIGDGFVPSVEGGLLTLVDPGSIALVYRAGE